MPNGKKDSATDRTREFQSSGLVSARFEVVVDGEFIGRYTEVTGLEVKIEMHEFKEGGVNGHVHQLPGRMTWPNIVLKRGITSDDKLLAWFHKTTGDNFAAKGKVSRTTTAISLVSNKNKLLRTWNLIGAVPVRWKGPTLAASSADVPEEELEVAHHGFTAESPA